MHISVWQLHLASLHLVLHSVLALLVAGCFSSGVIAKKIHPDSAQKRTQLSLAIKMVTALIALALYIVVFMT